MNKLKYNIIKLFKINKLKIIGLLFYLMQIAEQFTSKVISFSF